MKLNFYSFISFFSRKRARSGYVHTDDSRIENLRNINLFVLILTGILTSHYVINDLYAYQRIDLRNSISVFLLLLALLNFFLIRKKAYFPAKLITVFIYPATVLLHRIWGVELTGYYLWIPILIIAFSLFPYLVFSYKTEKIWLVASFLFYGTTLMFYEFIVSVGKEIIPENLYALLKVYPPAIKEIHGFAYLLISFVIYKSVRSNYDKLAEIEKLNIQLTELNQELCAERKAINESAILVKTDAAGTIRDVNENFVKITEYEKEELIGRNPRMLKSDEHPPEYFSHLWKTILGGEVWRGEMKNIRKDGSVYWLETSISPILDAGNKPRGFLSLRFDITKRKEYEMKLKKLIEQQEHLLSAVAHDLRGPILNILVMLEMINDSNITKTDKDKFLSLITVDCKNSLSLISELLEIGEIENENYVLAKDSVNIDDFCKSELASIECKLTDNGILLKSKFSAGSRTFSVNKEKLSRAIQNILSNALKFTPEGGSIKFTTRLVNDHNAEIVIEDTGIGIPEESLKNIFKRYSKVGRPGLHGEKSTGLGMSIVKSIVDLHDGEISIESKEHIGTAVKIKLPTLHSAEIEV
ncbi:MAG: PAS domain-containing sensor histidine kinase [Cytophagales bacterium]|nr:PAS domain-containing sensor histidine kinase [Cytophagales bacterium]